jgi:N-acetylmuramoyl-L-alanine amidase
MIKRLRRWNTLFIAAALVLCAIVVYIAVRTMSPVLQTAGESINTTPVLVFDAGHGGLDGGCSTPDGDVEKEINLNIVHVLDDLARLYGYETVLTRETDKSIYDKGVTGIRNQKISDMDNRLEIFNTYDNAVCVSVHQNIFTDPKYNGAQMFYSDSNDNNEVLAQIMQDKFSSTIQPYNEREIKLCGDELFLCYNCKNPTLMIECGFLSNPDEAAKLTDENYQREVAYVIFSGLGDFLATQNA